LQLILPVALAIALAPVAVAVYGYVVYPLLLWVIGQNRPGLSPADANWDWPTVTVTVPVYNAAGRIRHTLESLLKSDYPAGRLQILVLSDASTDGTDEIVRSFESRGVQLWRAPERRGKTSIENSAVPLALGEIIVNVDATVEVPSASLKKLVSVFADNSVGVASGRDVSVGASNTSGGESGYVRFEMRVRDLETRVGSIVGASGCFFGIRRSIHDRPLPNDLSWDFASALVARTKDYRSVSVADAICVVPSSGQMHAELARKARTMTRGLKTLFHFREVMNPLRYGSFALMLISHKLCRWLPYLLAPFALVAWIYVGTQRPMFGSLLGGGIALSVVAYGLAHRGYKLPRPMTWVAFATASFAAGSLAWYDALRGTRTAVWNPTERSRGAMAVASSLTELS